MATEEKELREVSKWEPGQVLADRTEGKDEKIVVMKVSAGGYEKFNGIHSQVEQILEAP